MPSEEVLQAAAGRLVRAVELYRAQPSVATADRVIEARLAVKEAFIAAGWEPPESTRAAMARDRLLLREHAGSFDDQTPAEGRADRRRSRIEFAYPTMRLAFSCAGPRLAIA